jgi:hypothetical protein
VHQDAIDRARERLAQAAAARPSPADVDAVLDRARAQLETLAQATAELQGALPARIADAVREGVRSEAHPVARQLAEVRGLSHQTVRRLEGIETDLRAERYSRVGDLGLLVDLITSSWRSLAERLDRMERALEAGSSATVHHLEERRAGA